jgi:hypothetical protein
MILISKNDINKYIDKRNYCIHRFDNNYSFTCSIDNRQCDIDTCPIIKRCDSIDDFILTIERQLK